MLKLGVRRRARVSRHRGRRAPLDYHEAVEKWARERGGHAKLVWYEDPMNCWAVVLSYKVGDPRAAGPDDGEPVFLHDWKSAEWWERNAPRRAKRHHRSNRVMPASYAYELDELGVQGIIERLDRGNILSGRGEFTSSEQAGRVQVEKWRDAKHRNRLSRRDDAKHRALENRRWWHKIPFLPVGIDLKRGKA